MSTQHTPGPHPSKLLNRLEHGAAVEAVSQANDLLRYVSLPTYSALAEQHAELLEAAKAYVLLAERMGWSIDPDGPIAKARAAITKATK